MGKGCKDKTRFFVKDHAQPVGLKGVGGGNGSGHFQQRTGAGQGQGGIPPGVPECDVVCKGSRRFWFLEPALFLFGIGGFLFSAAMLIRYAYFRN